MGSCKYRHIFGKEGEGVHKPRLLGVAAVDLVATILAAGIISYFSKTNFFLIFIALMLIAIVAHRLFCVNTALNVALGLRVT